MLLYLCVYESVHILMQRHKHQYVLLIPQGSYGSCFVVGAKALSVAVVFVRNLMTTL